jgi:Ca2+-binding EF-hand superfamily protein
MGTISSVSGSSDGWAQMRSQIQAKLFAKADANNSGGVDKTELNSLFNDIATQAGSTVSSAQTDKLFSSMDSNGDGSLSSNELAQGMQALMQPPSTMDFAQSRGAGDGKPEGGGAPPPPPPPAGAAAGASSSASSSTTYDPLDTNQDGTVSLAERMAGSSRTDPLQTLLKAMDSDGDGKISSSETDAFSKQLTDLVAKHSSTSASGTSGTSSSGFDASKLARMLYDQVASGLAQQSSTQSLSAQA